MSGIQPNSLPVSLRNHAQWVCWSSQVRGGKTTKVPIDPWTGDFASTADPNTWGTFDDVLTMATDPAIDGIGFVFTSGGPYVGVDLDGCRDPETGVLSDEAVEIVTRLHSYTEVSPSGTGLHIIVSGELPDGSRRRGSVEIYEESRFFTMTGRHLHATPQMVCHRSGPISRVHEAFVATPDSDGSHRSNVATRSRDDGGGENRAGSVLSEDELVKKASLAANGQKFMRLWEGSTNGYESHSEADMALCCLLAFWTGGDQTRMDSLFHRSGLMREKWDEVHYADGATYGERTMKRACAQVTEYYEDMR